MEFLKAPAKVAPDPIKLGMVTDAVFTDIDGDSDEDLVIVGEWMSIKVLENNKGIFSNVSSQYGLDDSTRGYGGPSLQAI